VGECAGRYRLQSEVSRQSHPEEGPTRENSNITEGSDCLIEENEQDTWNGLLFLMIIASTTYTNVRGSARHFSSESAGRACGDRSRIATLRPRTDRAALLDWQMERDRGRAHVRVPIVFCSWWEVMKLWSRRSRTDSQSGSVDINVGHESSQSPWSGTYLPTYCRQVAGQEVDAEKGELEEVLHQGQGHRKEEGLHHVLSCE